MKTIRCIRFADVLLDENRRPFILCANCHADFEDLDEFRIHLDGCEGLLPLFEDDAMIAVDCAKGIQKLGKTDAGVVEYIVYNFNEVHKIETIDTDKAQQQADGDDYYVNEFLNIQNENFKLSWYADFVAPSIADAKLVKATPFARFRHKFNAYNKKRKVLPKKNKQKGDFEVEFISEFMPNNDHNASKAKLNTKLQTSTIHESTDRPTIKQNQALSEKPIPMPNFTITPTQQAATAIITPLAIDNCSLMEFIQMEDERLSNDVTPTLPTQLELMPSNPLAIPTDKLESTATAPKQSTTNVNDGKTKVQTFIINKDSLSSMRPVKILDYNSKDTSSVEPTTTAIPIETTTLAQLGPKFAQQRKYVILKSPTRATAKSATAKRTTIARFTQPATQVPGTTFKIYKIPTLSAQQVQTTKVVTTIPAIEPAPSAPSTVPPKPKNVLPTIFNTPNAIEHHPPRKRPAKAKSKAKPLAKKRKLPTVAKLPTTPVTPTTTTALIAKPTTAQHELPITITKVESLAVQTPKIQTAQILSKLETLGVKVKPATRATGNASQATTAINTATNTVLPKIVRTTKLPTIENTLQNVPKEAFKICDCSKIKVVKLKSNSEALINNLAKLPTIPGNKSIANTISTPNKNIRSVQILGYKPAIGNPVLRNMPTTRTNTTLPIKTTVVDKNSLHNS